MKHNEHIKGCRKDYCGSGDSCNGGIYLCPICSSKQAGIKQGYAQALEKIEDMIKCRYNELEILNFISKELAKFKENK